MIDLNIIKLSQKTKNLIDNWIKKFPIKERRSAIIPSLSIVQDEHGGWLTKKLMDSVASYLKVPKIHVYEVATFYSMYELRPVGKYKICICTNISCMLCGSDGIVSHLKRKLNVGFNEITQDGKFSLKEVECLASCGAAPVMQIGDKYYENLTPSYIDKILEDLE